MEIQNEANNISFSSNARKRKRDEVEMELDEEVERVSRRSKLSEHDDEMVSMSDARSRRLNNSKLNQSGYNKSKACLQQDKDFEIVFENSEEGDRLTNQDDPREEAKEIGKIYMTKKKNRNQKKKKGG